MRVFPLDCVCENSDSPAPLGPIISILWGESNSVLEGFVAKVLVPLLHVAPISSWTNQSGFIFKLDLTTGCLHEKSYDKGDNSQDMCSQNNQWHL